ncbi:MAG: TatD family hydrolase, partial [Bacteroidota bacterium]
MISWTDTHAHIYSKQFDADRAETVQRAAEAGVEHIFMPNIDEASIDAMLDAESRYPACKPMMGLHPCHVQQDFEKSLYIIESWLNRRKFLAIGEIGTDLYWDK